MGYWEVQLLGDSLDLEELPGIFSDADIAVVESGSTYYLRSHEFAASSDASEVTAAADELVATINGLMRIQHTNWRNVRASGPTWVDDKGSRAHALRPDNMEGHLRMSGQLLILSSTGNVPPQPSNRELERFRKRSVYPLVKTVLHWMGEPHADWRVLRNILETIENDVGGESQILGKGWVTTDELEAFIASAHNFIVSGEDALHGRLPPAKELNKKRPPKTMTLAAATDMIRVMAEKWIDSKP